MLDNEVYPCRVVECDILIALPVARNQFITRQ